MGHDKERGADDAFVGAIEDRLRDRKGLCVERADNAILAIDRMRGRQQLARRLAPQHVAPCRRLDEISWIGLTAFKLAERDRSGKAGYMRAHIGFEPAGVEAQSLGDFLGAGIGALAIAGGHLPGARLPAVTIDAS